MRSSTPMRKQPKGDQRKQRGAARDNLDRAIARAEGRGMTMDPIIEDNDICTCGKLIVMVQDDVDCVGDPPRYVASYVWQHADGSPACKEYED